MEQAQAGSTRPEDAERRIVLNGISWEQYDAILAALGDSPGVRLAYLEGVLEIMSPSRRHERLKTRLGRLLEVYATEMEVPLEGFGSATFRKKAKARGVEPDECYVLSERPVEDPEVPDLAIEVVLARWDIDKLSLYAGLGVKELWLVRRGALELHVLSGAAYRRVRRSRLIPELDLALLWRYATRADLTQTRAAREYAAALRRA